ncbi:hypothetical protein SETIT_7G159000v2 [Setaria italica]|uniref:Uncharacterized protein n=2 Tax=Setaria TaxID=4554 RepID=A0A368RW30_SETIT|nr:hypothetical protein SETIT_7G159000v2 [Setaria italica]TKW05318.1 hypothetical protein SEVIR_7G167600v2 [Setaria viridis]
MWLWNQKSNKVAATNVSLMFLCSLGSRNLVFARKFHFHQGQ